MTDFEERPSPENYILAEFIELPEEFDAREKWDLLPIKN